jgi:hypothetical protein
MPRKLIQVDHIILAKTWKLFEHLDRRMSAHDLADDFGDSHFDLLAVDKSVTRSRLDSHL